MQHALLSLLFSGLGRDALKVATALLLAVTIALAFAISSVASLFAAVAPGHAIAGARAEEIPSDQLPAIQAAAATCGLPWQALAAVAQVESDFGRTMATGSGGAMGYGQMLPEIWAAFGSGGDPYDYHDALPAMARSLCDHGGAQDLRQALFHGSHANWRGDQILAVAVRYGYLAPGESHAQVVDLARAQTGRLYVWGGASPETSFDCSGLVQWVYRQLNIGLPRTAQQQFDATARLSPEELQPGDLVFFAQTYPSAEWITHVGIYVGNGRMINAPTEGDVVREMVVFTGYWGAHYAGGGRVRR